MNPRGLFVLALALLALATAGCGGGGSSAIPAEGAFRVTAVTPTPGSEGVALTQEINVIFSRPVDPLTLFAGSLDVVASNGQVILGTRHLALFNKTIVRFLPDEEYVSLATHQIRLTQAIRDENGVPLDRAYTYTFKTQEAPPDLPRQSDIVDLGNLLRRGRFLHRMTLLDSGRFLIAGGYTTEGQQATTTAENLIPALGQSTLTTSEMASPRAAHCQLKLADGRVLLAGGEQSESPFTPLTTCEIFDPDPGVFAFGPAASMQFARSHAHATLLTDGRVLVTGGQGDDGAGGVVFRDDAEIYDPETDTWSLVATAMDTGRSGHASFATPQGDVIVVGGTFGDLPTATRFDASEDEFVAITAGFSEHIFGAQAPLPGGRAIVATGFGTRALTLWDPVLGFVNALNALASERAFASATAFPDGRVFLVGGFDFSTSPPLVHSTLDVFFPDEDGSGRAYRALGVQLPEPTSHHAAALGPDGRIWVTGGLPLDAGAPGLRQVTLILPGEPDEEEDE